MATFGRTRSRKADRLLAEGRLTEAIALYRQKGVWDGLMAAYEQTGDMASAGEAARKAGLHDEAARLFEKSGMFDKAAEAWIQASRRERAAAALEKAEDYEAAAELYKDLDMPSRAATALAVAGRYAEAGKLYEQVSAIAKAIEMYEAADQPGEAARVLDESGDAEGAARAYARAGNDVRAAEMFISVGRPAEAAQCHLNMGNHRQAGDILVDCEHLFEAAEAYALDEDLLDDAAEIYRKVFRSEVAWQHDIQGPIVCSGMSEDGALIGVGAARKLRMFNHKGELLWRFVPTWGGNPRCLAVSLNRSSILGCDDGHLYCLDADKNILWTSELQNDPLKVNTNPPAGRIVCCTEGHLVVCLDGEGNVKWEHQAETIVWDTAVSPDGKIVAIGTADGRCVLLTGDGEHIGEYRTAKWVHSLSVANDAVFALATGMNGVELVDGRQLKPIWSAQEDSPVHNVLLTPAKNVLSVGDDEVLLRGENATVIWRYPSETRLLSGHIDAKQRIVVLRCQGKKLLRLNLYDCKSRAADCLARADKCDQAAVLYEEIQDHKTAARMFRDAGDYAGAARNTEITGPPLEAAELYQRAGDLPRAALLYESLGELARAAACFDRAGETLKAAELSEQCGELEKAAELFRKAGEHGKAGELYGTVGDTAAAMSSLTEHVDQHPDDGEKRFQLGLLLQADGQYDKAIEHFQTTAAVEELRRESVMHVAECFMGKDMYEIAIHRYRACLGADEDVSWDNRGIFYGLAKACHLAGNYSEAKRIYESILAVDFRYEDVTGRLEDVRKLSNVFSRQESVTTSVEQTMVADQEFQQLSSEKKERYVPIRKLGEGGMGTVYLAEDRRLNRQVALKMLSASLRADGEMRLRIIQEAQLIAQVVHPNVVGVFDVGEEQGSSYVSMEYVEGQTLGEMLKSTGPFNPKECVPLLVQVAEGLSAAHSKGVAHRDIKPANIMVTENGIAKIMDFGLALVSGATRMTMPGAVSGTPLYMAPEQVRGESHLTPAVDIYAFGCLAYELLTGKPPFTEGNVGIQHLNNDPKSLVEIDARIPASLDKVIMTCLSKNVPDRYPDGAALADALREVETDV